MNTPVNFELAKLLKEKGFDEDCYRTYSNGEISPFPLLENMGGEPILNPLDYKWKNSSIHYSLVTAPTIAEVVMWLYEKYGIWVECYIDDNGTFGYLVSMITKEGRIDFPLKREFKSPTEAYEAAIKYTLQNLLS